MRNIREKLVKVCKRINDDFWKIGPMLQMVQDGSMHREWGFGMWKDYVETELSMGVRKAQMSMSMTKWKDEMPGDSHEWIAGLPWYQLKAFYMYVDSKNWRTWRDNLGRLSFSERVGYVSDFVAHKNAAYRDGLGNAVLSKKEEQALVRKNVKKLMREMEKKRGTIRSIKTTISIPEDLYESIMFFAKDGGLSLEQEISEALKGVYGR